MNNVSWSYGYDGLGQLVSADKSASPACQFDYVYDNIGNRLTAGVGGVGIVVRNPPSSIPRLWPMVPGTGLGFRGGPAVVDPGKDEGPTG